MACINKSDERYKALEERYGEFLATSYVRGNILNKKLASPEDLYIPSIGEVTKYFKDVSKPRKLKEMQDALKLNPLLDIKAIQTILQGVITKHKGAYFVVKGPNNKGPIHRQLVLKEIFDNNLSVINRLVSDHPNIFDVSYTKDPTTVIVKITPATEAEYIPEIQSSIAAYNDMLIDSGGIQPSSFVEGDHVWQRVGNHEYTLIDAATGDPFLRDINLLTGTEVTPSLFPVNKLEAEAEIQAIRESYDNEYWRVDLALRGYNLDQILNNLENAETQQEFDEQVFTLKKITC